MSDDVGFVCPHCTTKIKYTAGMTFGEVMSLRHDKEHLSHKITCLRADLAAVTAERDRMRQSINSMIVRLEMAYNMIERPTHSPLDVGFRHSPLSQKEIIQRLTETCLFVRADLSKLMDEARAALEGGKEPPR